jgi:hypothetical protein
MGVRRELQETSLEFCEFWRPLCTLDMSIWQKWLHTHSIRMFLTPDMPLSPHLHKVNTFTNRFTSISIELLFTASYFSYGIVHCRMASTVVHDFLAKWASFTLIEQQCYIKLASDADVRAYGDISADSVGTAFRKAAGAGIVEAAVRPPRFFYIIRICMRPPCMVIKVAFLGGIRGAVRHAASHPKRP